MQKRKKGQALLEYLLMVIMLAVTVAVTFRNSTRTIYRLWTGLARQVSLPCPDCSGESAPDLP